MPDLVPEPGVKGSSAERKQSPCFDGDVEGAEASSKNTPQDTCDVSVLTDEDTESRQIDLLQRPLCFDGGEKRASEGSIFYQLALRAIENDEKDRQIGDLSQISLSTIDDIEAEWFFIQNGQVEVDFQKGNRTPDTKRNSLKSRLSNEEQPSKTTSQHLLLKHFQIISIILLIVSLTLATIAIVLTQYHLPPPSPRPPSQFHHAFFLLKTRGYTELDEVINLQWIKDESQNEGDIKLINESYIFIPQDGIYQITCAVQLEIPKDTPPAITTLMLQRKNRRKDYVFMKKSSSSLNISEHAMIQLSFRYKLAVNDTVTLKMNMAKFISRNTPSSFLYMSRLN